MAKYTPTQLSQHQLNALINNANSGNMAAAVELGVMYAHGINVKKDLDRALKYTEKAAAAGIPEGIINYAKLYIDNQIDVDKGIAILSSLYSHPSEAIRQASAFNLGVYFSQNGYTTEAITHYKRAADNGSVGALHNLGILYAKSGMYADARAAWKSAMQKGDVAATYSYGLTYICPGLDLNESLGLKYVLQAARKGYDLAITELREHYKLDSTISDEMVLQFVAEELGVVHKGESSSSSTSS